MASSFLKVGKSNRLFLVFVRKRGEAGAPKTLPERSVWREAAFSGLLGLTAVLIAAVTFLYLW